MSVTIIGNAKIEADEHRAVHVKFYLSGARWDYESEGWTVHLPHQCDNWDITEEDELVAHSEAVAALQRFIAATAKALVFLIGQDAKPGEQVKWDSSKRQEDT